MLKKLFIVITVVLVLLLAILSAVAYIVAEDKPLVTEKVRIDDAERVVLEQLVEQNRPGAVIQSSLKNITLNTVQLNQLIQYASEKMYAAVSSDAVPVKNRLKLRMSYQLPANPFGEYLNIRATLRINLSKYIYVDELKIGQLGIPPLAVTLLRPVVVEQINKKYASYVGLWEYLRRIDLSRNGIVIHYRLERSDLAQVRKISRKIMVNTETRDRVLSYTKELSRITRNLPVKEQSVINLLKPMFAFAGQQAVKSQNAVEENKMALLVIGAYMNGKNPELYVMEEIQNPFKNIHFTLAGRRDLAKHYVISSAVNALSGTRWSNTIGFEKEIEDSKTGSGFSFVDLMADIAGNKLAQAALDNKRAVNLQTVIAGLENEDAIFAHINGLDEGISENEFRLEYGTTNSDEYIAVVREIERRLYRCVAYR